MINFPAICIDNFFDKPDKVREWGLSLSKQKDPEGRWPGKRSEHLFKIDEQWNQNLIVKILLAYFTLLFLFLAKISIVLSRTPQI